MLKKGEQIIVINDPTQAPIKYFHRLPGNESGIVPQIDGLSYPNNGTYKMTAGSITEDNHAIVAPTYSVVPGSEINWERMSISGYNVNIDALKVIRAYKYAAVAEQIEQAALTVTTPAAAVGSFITVELTLTCLDKYLHEFNTVFADGNIKIIRDFKVATNTNAGIVAAIAEQFNNIQMRLNNENPTMNVVATAGSAATSGDVVTFKTANSAITISSITITETPASGLPALVATYFPAKTALVGALTTVAQNQVGFAGRGIYNIMRNDFPQTAYKVYPYSDESFVGQNRPLVGATYTAYLISLKIQSQTHGEYNTAPVEYFDYWIYVNNTCTTVNASIGSWLNTLNSAASTAGRKTHLLTSGALDYAAAYTAWTVPPRLVFAAPTLSTGAENITTLVPGTAYAVNAGFNA